MLSLLSRISNLLQKWVFPGHIFIAFKKAPAPIHKWPGFMTMLLLPNIIFWNHTKNICQWEQSHLRKLHFLVASKLSIIAKRQKTKDLKIVTFKYIHHDTGYEWILLKNSYVVFFNSYDNLKFPLFIQLNKNNSLCKWQISILEYNIHRVLVERLRKRNHKILKFETYSLMK